jgi:predicted RNase H-like HicB family nuclease
MRYNMRRRPSGGNAASGCDDFGEDMRLRELTLHGLLRHEQEGYWAAYCLDFTLYAVGDTPEEAMTKLRVIVDEYLVDALIGDDQPYAKELLNRRAPWTEWALVYWLSFLQHCRKAKDRVGSTAFDLPVHMVPCNHA